MLSGQHTSSPDALPANNATSALTSTPSSRWAFWLARAIDFSLVLFVILLPHSIKGAQRAWKIGFLLWLGKLGIERSRPFDQPLSAPLLAYVTLSGISTALSPEPCLSWDRMKIVCLVLVGVLFAQNLKRLSQIRVLVYLLLLSGLGAAGYTAWQYTYGVGVQITHISPGTRLYTTGIIQNDIITAVNGRSVHTVQQLQKAIAQSPTHAPMRIDYLRGFPFQKLETAASRADFVTSGYGTPRLQIERGKPTRAQGTLGHYVVFAEMLMQIGCLAWVMLLSVQPGKPGLRGLFAGIFLAVAAALVSTETRAALGGLALGCLLALWFLTGKKMRVWTALVLSLLMAPGALWIHHTRGLSWTSANDTGTQFRMLMWEDGLRLVREHPWFGVGMETVRIHWREWNIRGFIQFHVMGHFHSTPLQIAVERGLPTLAAWLWFIVAYIAFLLRLIRRLRNRNRFATAVVTAALAGFVAFLTTSLAHYNLGEEPLVTAIFFFFGLAVAIDHMLGEPAALDVE